MLGMREINDDVLLSTDPQEEDFDDISEFRFNFFASVSYSLAILTFASLIQKCMIYLLYKYMYSVHVHLKKH